MSVRYPLGHVFYRNLHRSYPVIKSGRGIYLYGSRGKEFLDASGGAAVANIGHGLPEIARAMALQAGQVAYLSGLQFSHDPVENLAERISQFLPFPDGRIYFLTSGSEVVEAAIKLAMQYWVERGQDRKHLMISCNPSYHGNTLAALSLSGRRHYQEAFQPLLIRSAKIPAAYCYRCAWNLDYPGCGIRCGLELEREIERRGAEEVSAFIVEVIGGATTGASVPPPEYFKIVRETCDRRGVLLIADEIMTGVGRTGKWLASHHFDLVPDMITMGKGLTGGYFPLSALAVKKEIVAQIQAKGRNFLHAQTYSHHPVGCAVGLAALDYIDQHDLVERSAARGEQLLVELSPLFSHPRVGDIRGKGLLIGVEFVEEKAEKKPFPRAKRYAETFFEECLAEGLVVWPNVGQADGTNGDLILLAPPFIVEPEELTLIVEKLGRVLARMSKTC
ncbi:MAG: aspartate aminotransferase family protein [Acidobacteriota bacterium]